MSNPLRYPTPPGPRSNRSTRGRAGIRSGRIALALAAGLAGLTVGAIAARMWPAARPPHAGPQPVTFTVMLPPGFVVAGNQPAAIAFSPDGRRIAIAAEREGGPETALFVRDLDQLATRRVAGAEGATSPFFSPDGRSIGFYAYGRLRRVPVEGGAPADICRLATPDFKGADWSRRGDIVFGSAIGLMRVPAGGGTPALLTRADGSAARSATGGRTSSRTANTCCSPRGRTASTTRASISSRSPAATVNRSPRARATRGTGDGHLIMMRSGGAAAVAFDPAILRVTGEPVQLRVPVLSDPFYGSMALSASAGGAVAYAPGSSAVPALRVMRLGADGAPTRDALQPRPFRAGVVARRRLGRVRRVGDDAVRHRAAPRGRQRRRRDAVQRSVPKPPRRRGRLTDERC